MTYNIWFNVCSLLMLSALLCLYYIKFQAPFTKYKLFVGLVWLSLISTVASLLNNTLPGLAPIWVLQCTNILYFLAHSMILPMLMLYIYSLTDYSLRTWQRMVPWMIPSGFSLLLILTNWFSNSIFWLDEAGGYHRGEMILLLYAITAFNFAAVTYILISNVRLIPRPEWISVLVFLMISASAVIIQLFFPYLLVENFASAICMMISQLAVQNPELIMDGSAGMLNKQGFANLVTPLFERKQKFEIGYLLVDNYHELEKIYGFDQLESSLSTISDYLKAHSGSIYARLDNRVFCFVPSNFQANDTWEALFQDLEADPLLARMKQERVSIRFRLKTGVFHCPEDVASFGELVGLLESVSKMSMPRNREIHRLTLDDTLRLRRRKQVDELVHTAVEDGSLKLVYQPIYSLKDNCFSGAEALLRMNTASLGMIPPYEFISVAEENGAILSLTNFVISSVCEFLRTTKLSAQELRRVHINLSAIDCARTDLSQRILSTIEQNGISPDRVSVEITETAFISLPDSVLANLMSLSDAGISVMLDDYGTGYSNLNRLYRIPLHVVKLDKSLIDDITTSSDARVIVENTVAMVKRLNRRVLCEGVETKEQADYLRQIGVDYIQGFYFARPMDAEKMEELFRSQAQKPPADGSGKQISVHS